MKSNVSVIVNKVLCNSAFLPNTVTEVKVNGTTKEAFKDVAETEVDNICWQQAELIKAYRTEDNNIVVVTFGCGLDVYSYLIYKEKTHIVLHMNPTLDDSAPLHFTDPEVVASAAKGLESINTPVTEFNLINYI